MKELQTTTRKEKQGQFLKKAALSCRLSHAYIFSGDDERSKKQIGRDLIQLLCCTDTPKPCAICQSCKAFAQGTHPDVCLLKAEEDKESVKNEITIAQIRKLHFFLNLRSWVCPWKIVVIQDAHCMNEEAQGALLKLLEEPKGNTLFLLYTLHPDLLLSTLRSRSQVIAWYLSPTAFSKEYQISSRVAREFEQIFHAPLHIRFEYAKKLVEDEQRLLERLTQMLLVLRLAFLEKLKNGATPELLQIKRQLTVAQETFFFISRTSVNPRLALERMFLCFDDDASHEIISA